MAKPRCLGAGVVVVSNAIASLDEQRALLEDSLRTMPPVRAGGVHLGSKPPPPAAMSFEVDTAPSSAVRPACLRVATDLLHSLGTHSRLGSLFAADSRERSSSLHLLPIVQSDLVFQNVWARLYSGSNALGWHRDPYHGLKGWVCIINLGAGATFAWRHGGQGAMVHRAQLSSGDALIFNGEILEHAIEEIHDESTCPPYWRDVMDQAALGGGANFLRVGLQMRA